MPGKARSIFALLALALMLGTGAAQALPVDGPARAQSPGMLVAVWDWLTSAVPVLHVLDAATANSTAAQPRPQTQSGDIGGFIDPNGHG